MVEKSLQDLRGHEMHLKIPDFIIANATETLNNDKVLLVVEMKQANF